MFYSDFHLVVSEICLRNWYIEVRIYVSVQPR